MSSITDYFEKRMRGAKVNRHATLMLAIFLGAAVLIILIAHFVD
jgi:hypothetical protein